MEIKVLGTGCSTCMALYNNVVKAVEELGLDTKVEKIEDMMEIMQFNVLRTPALVIDGKVVSSGAKLPVDKIKELLTK
ncbi:MAG: redox-active disulfide protein 2 [Bacteroidetes bacterium]|nr:redox-active disulfide protein 2 [Bacteroidota bacterium]